VASYQGLSFKNEIMARWMQAPWVGEPADLGQAGHFEDLNREITLYHASSFGNGNLNGETSNGTSIANFQAANKQMGFRLSITAGTVTSTAGLQLSLTWTNTGVAPTYENWNVIFQLRAGSTVKWTGTSTFKPKLFLPGTLTVNDTFSDTPAGTWDLYVVVQDPTGVRSPMPLALSSPTQGGDGAYLLQSGLVVGTGGTPPPPPPPPQTTYSIFTTQVPPTITENDAQPSTGIELGVRFKTTVGGTITGIKFYKTSGNTGTHTGELYDNAGKQLLLVHQ
jgi:hypothetical protein